MVLKKVYTSTLKEILRSRVTRICCIISLIYCFFIHGGNFYGPMDKTMPHYGATVAIYTLGAGEYTFLICIIVVCVCFLSDRNHSFDTIIRATRIKPASYLLGKGLAYLTFYYVWSIILLVEYYYSSYSMLSDAGQYFQYVSFPFWTTLRNFAVCYVYLVIPFGLFYVAFIMMISGISNRRAIAILVCVLYYEIPSFSYIFLVLKEIPFLTSYPKLYKYFSDQLTFYCHPYMKLEGVLFPTTGLLQPLSLLLLSVVCFLILYFVYIKRVKE